MLEKVLGVSQKTGQEYKRCCIIFINRTASNRTELQIKSEISELEAVKTIVSSVEQAGTENDDEQIKPTLLDNLTSAFTSKGYQVEEIPLEKFQSGNVSVYIKAPDIVLCEEQQAPNTEMVRNIYELSRKMVLSSLESLVEELETLTNSNEHLEAFVKLEQAYETGILSLRSNFEILEISKKINELFLSDEQKFTLFRIKFFIAKSIARFDLVEDEGKAFLDKYSHRVDDKTKHNIILLRANAAAQKGKKELAYALYKQLLEKESDVDSATRAWIYKGVASILDSNDPQFRTYHEIAADACLQSGQRIEASRSLFQIASSLEHVDPHLAIEFITKAYALVKLDSLIEKEFKAALLHSKARILFSLGDFQSATNEIKKSIELRRDLLGCEDSLLSSIILASNIAKELNQNEEVETLNSEIQRLKPVLRDEKYKLRVRFSEAIQTGGSQSLENIYKEIETQKDNGLIVLFHTHNALSNPNLSYEDKLDELEKALKTVNSFQASVDHWKIVCSAFAEIYLSFEKDEEAISWYRKTLSYDPFNYHAIQNLGGLLWKNSLWDEAVLFFENQRERFGDVPEILYCYGRSLLEAGKPNEAVKPLLKAKKQLNDPVVQDFFEKAVEMSSETTFEEYQQYSKSESIITVRALEKCLQTFTKFIQCDKRMSFWKYSKESKNHIWIEKPEKYAQDLLHTSLKMNFKEDIDVFEEIDSGAGRTDIFLRFSGGLEVIFELKMCGGGYSKNYAANGLNQLQHYLTNRGTSLGYLIVFDGRINDFGTGLSEVETIGKQTIYTKFIDIRHKY